MICHSIFKQSLIHVRFDLVIPVYEANPSPESLSHSMQACRCNASILLKDRLYP